ncbi:MAG TPA: hypothetical protein VN957_13220 [Chthoniobacterales bacterium]|nr:hypothetical protein [Chthoniobacterales bacterium]
MEYWSNGVIERLPSGNAGNVKRSVSLLFTVAIAIVLLITDYRLPITDYRLPITDYSQDADEKRVWR